MYANGQFISLFVNRNWEGHPNQLHYLGQGDVQTKHPFLKNLMMEANQVLLNHGFAVTGDGSIGGR